MSFMQKEVIIKNDKDYFYSISESVYNDETKELLEVGQAIENKYLKLKQDNGDYLYYKKGEENNIEHLLYLIYNKMESTNFWLKTANEQLQEIFKIQRFFYILTMISLMIAAGVLLYLWLGK